VLLFVVPATLLFVYLVPFSFFPFNEQRWIPYVISWLCAIGVGWFVWKKLRSVPSGLASTVVLGGFIVGGIGFCVGFFGPIIFSPEANQGPLLGIFITGPLGFLLGLLGGFIYWRIRRKKMEGASAISDQP
jgi:hypothetical protein